MLMHRNCALDKLWIGVCCLSSKEFVQLIVSVFKHIYIYRDKIMNDVGICQEREGREGGREKDAIASGSE